MFMRAHTYIYTCTHTNHVQFNIKYIICIITLFQIGQIAFQGIKNLNRIQTVVFDTAYHSNENLLICAPTGAGKTNIALLTVVHCLRQHMNQGLIQKDQFKVITLNKLCFLFGVVDTVKVDYPINIHSDGRR